MSAALDNGIADSLRRGVDALLALQSPTGEWNAPDESDPSLTANYLLASRYVNLVDSTLEREMVEYLRGAQGAAGGWTRWPGGAHDLDATVLCYAALRASGASTEEPAMEAARKVIRELGGIGGIGLLARIPLVFLGQLPVEAIPHVSPALLSAPSWLHPNLQDYGVFRLALAPLSLLLAKGAVRRLPGERGITELGGAELRWRVDAPEGGWRLEAVRRGSSGDGGLSAAWIRMRMRGGLAAIRLVSSLARLFDGAFPAAEPQKRLLAWILARREADGTFGGIFHATMLSIMALDACGRPDDAERELTGLRRWSGRDERGAWQGFAPAANGQTAAALRALLAAGLSHDHPAVTSAVRWLVESQAVEMGDWCRGRLKHVQPGGWAYGTGRWYPDCDSTAQVLQALLPVRDRCLPAFARGVAWLLAMQHACGGWAAWDGGNTFRCGLLTEPLVPGCADLPDVDITARTLMVLGPLIGSDLDPSGALGRAARRAIAFLVKSRRRNGSWYGRWVCNFAYGTGQALEGLAACSAEERVGTRMPGSARRIDILLRESREWLERVQNADGGWGESHHSYVTGTYEPCESSPLATAHVLHGLIASGGAGTECAGRALAYLVHSQRRDGLWDDAAWSGVAFPGSVALNYRFVPTALCAVALARAARLTSR